MSPAQTMSLAALAAYLVGSIPFGLLIAKYGHGIDVRTQGSGNIGATNVGRVLGRQWGLACLLLDFLKGFVPTLWFPQIFALPSDWEGSAAVVCGTAAILGHVFPLWLGFRGGKGVATGAGVAVVLSPWAAAAAVLAFAVLFAARRIVSLASMVAACLYAATALVLAQDWPTRAFAVAIPALIVLRHRDNIRRLWRGEEFAYSPARGAPRKQPTPAEHATTGGTDLSSPQ
jgi:glycerol-3-phosphate acyltransferase PlsY